MRTACRHELHRLAGGQVLDHGAKAREAAGDVGEDRVEKHALAVENVHARSRDLSVNEQGQLLLLHGGKCRIDAFHTRDAGL